MRRQKSSRNLTAFRAFMSSWHDSATIWVTAERKQISLYLSSFYCGAVVSFSCLWSLFWSVRSKACVQFVSWISSRPASFLVLPRNFYHKQKREERLVCWTPEVAQESQERGSSCALSLAPVCLRHLFFTVAVKTGWDCVRLWVIRDGSHHCLSSLSHRRRFIWRCCVTLMCDLICEFLYCTILLLTCESIVQMCTHY